MARDPARPIAALASLEAGAAMFVRGRVLDLAGTQALLADPSGRALVRSDVALAPGALVEGTARRDPDLGLALTDVRTLVTPLGDGLHPDGDVRRLLGHPERARRILLRSASLRALRAWFDANDYVEVETPTLVPNPGMDVHLDAFRVEGAPRPRHLATSPEYAMKRLVAAGFPRIYQITRSYRRDESGAMHEPEFTILEWYRSHVGMDALLRETEELAAEVARTCNEGRTWVQREGRKLDLAPGWPRMSVREAVRTYADRDLDALLEDEETLFEVLSFEVQPKLGLDRPIWLVDWPISMASLARPCPTDPTVAERFEAYAQGIELCNGFGELTDPIEQRRRFEADLRERAARGKDRYPLDERFLRALEDGLPPCAGNALGVDRLLMIATAATDIDEVCAITSRHQD